MVNSKPAASAKRKKVRSLTIRLTRPENELIAWAGTRCGVSIGRFMIDAALAVAIPLHRALTIRESLHK